MTHANRASPDGGAGLDTALGGQEQRCADSNQRADEQPGAYEPYVLPVDRPSERSPAGTLHGRCVIVTGGKGSAPRRFDTSGFGIGGRRRVGTLSGAASIAR